MKIGILYFTQKAKRFLSSIYILFSMNGYYLQAQCLFIFKKINLKYSEYIPSKICLLMSKIGRKVQWRRSLSSKMEAYSSLLIHLFKKYLNCLNKPFVGISGYIPMNKIYAHICRILLECPQIFDKFQPQCSYKVYSYKK